MKKFILKLDLQDDKEKRKALKIVSSLPGIDSISIDMKDKKLTVIGTVDPVSVVSKLRKFWPTDMILVGPAKEPEKKEAAKKEEAKKEEAKKEEEGKKDEEGKKEEPKKEEDKKETEETKKEEEKKKDNEAAIEIMPYRPYYPPAGVMPYRPYYPQMSAMPYRPYNPPMNTYYHHTNHSIEENPNACVIC